MGTINILGIAGSIRKNSFNKATLRAAQALMPEGAELRTIEIDTLPLFNEDIEKNPPQAVTDLKRSIKEANGILLVTPEYNYSVSGVLKNAIDWASRPYGDSAWVAKPALIMGASVGLFGSARAQYHLRQICVSLNMHVLNQPEIMIAKAAEKFDREGNLIDDSTKEHIQKAMKALIEWTKRFNQ